MGILSHCTLQYNTIQYGLLVTPHRGFSELIYKWIDLMKLIYNMVTYINKFVKENNREK